MVTLQPVPGEELFFARVALRTSDVDPSIAQVIDSFFVDGCQLADYIENRMTESRSILELYEALQMAS
jgi:hypothetical protein